MVGSATSALGEKVKLVFPNAHIVREASNDLLSVSVMVDRGFEFHFRKEESYMLTPDGHKLVFIRYGGLFWLKWNKVKVESTSSKSLFQSRDIPEFDEWGVSNLLDPDDNILNLDHISSKSDYVCKECSILSVKSNMKQKLTAATNYHDTTLCYHSVNVDKHLNLDMKLFHRRMGHFNKPYLQVMAKQGDLGNVTLRGGIKDTCDTCRLCKATKRNPPTTRDHHPTATKPFQQIWSDVKGPLKPDAWGNTYFVTFNDEHTRHSSVFFAKTKDEISERFEDFNKWVKSLGHTIELLTSDNGGEYDGGENKNPSIFNSVCDRLAIRQRFTAYYTSAMNGISERINRTYGDCAACILHDAVLTHQYWSLAVKHVCWIRNRLIHRALDSPYAPHHQSPYQTLLHS